MKPDVLPVGGIKEVMGKGDVCVVLWPDFQRLLETTERFANVDGYVGYNFGGGTLCVAIRPFGQLTVGHYLRFRSLTGETDWGGIAEYCSIFDGARELTKYATQQAAGTKDEEHG